MRAYAIVWPNGSVSVCIASGVSELPAMADELADPVGAVYVELCGGLIDSEHGVCESLREELCCAPLCGRWAPFTLVWRGGCYRKVAVGEAAWRLRLYQES